MADKNMLEVVVAASRPYVPTEPHALQGPYPSRVLQLPDDLADLCAVLEKEFTVAKLKKGKLYHQPSGEKPALVNWFSPGGRYVPLRRSARGGAFELVGKAGRLCASGCILDASCDDYYVSPQIDLREMIVAYTLDEVDVLQRFNMAVSLGDDLAGLDGAALTRLLGVPDVLRRSQSWALAQKDAMKVSGCDVSPAAVAKFDLLGWNLSALNAEPPAPLDNIVDFLADAERTLGFDLTRWKVWRPKAADFEQFRAAIALRDPHLLGAALWLSFAQSRMPISAYRAERQKGPPPSWSDVIHDSRRRLEAELQRCLVPSGAPQVKTALRDYLTNLRRGQSVPWRQKSATVPATRRATYWQAADLIDQWILLDPTARRAEHVVQFGNRPQDPLSIREDAERRAALSQQLERMLVTIDRLERPRGASREPASAPLATSRPADAPALSPRHHHSEDAHHGNLSLAPQPR